VSWYSSPPHLHATAAGLKRRREIRRSRCSTAWHLLAFLRIRPTVQACFHRNGFRVAGRPRRYFPDAPTLTTVYSSQVNLLTPNPTALTTVRQLARWSGRRWVAVALAAMGAAILVGAPTGVLPTPYFTRMTPVLWWNYPVWTGTAILIGLIIATYVDPVVGSQTRTGRLTGGALLSALAVGCPVCNKLVVATLGTTGALTVWAPLQPILALAALMMLGYTLFCRLRGESVCPAGPPPPASNNGPGACGRYQ
jgi:hypothetical protein